MDSNGRAGTTGIAYKSAGMTALSLGVSGLHDTAAGQMQVGRVYALDTDVPSIRFPLVSSCLASAMAEGVPCTLIVRSKPEHYLESLNTPPKFDMGEVLARRQLNVFSMQDDFQKKLFQVGPNRMLGELTRYGIESGSLVVFEHASEILNMFDQQYASAQLDAISDWCANQGITALLVFSGVQVRNALPPKALLDGMAGMARMEQGLDGLLVSFPYWRSNGQLVSGLLTRVQMSPQGEYVASPLMLASPDWVRPVPAEEWSASRENEALMRGTTPGYPPEQTHAVGDPGTRLFPASSPSRDFEGRHVSQVTEFSARVRRLNTKAKRSVPNDFAEEAR